MTEENTPETPPEAPETPQGNREAAKYRTQLRESETAREDLAARVEKMQRAEAERLAGTTIEKPSGLWATGTTLEDLLDDDGEVDPDKVTAAATAASEQLGLTKPPRGPIIPSQGQVPDFTPDPTKNWEGAFAAKR